MRGLVVFRVEVFVRLSVSHAVLHFQLERLGQILVLEANGKLLGFALSLGVVHAEPAESLRRIVHLRHVEVRSDELVEDELEDLFAAQEETEGVVVWMVQDLQFADA
jgi:hypothetical protein